MTTKEEDILMSENLIKKGVVIDKLLDSLIVTKGVTTDNLVVGIRTLFWLLLVFLLITNICRSY